jgi:DNA-binding CsgD family transcriptional regulator
MLVRQDRRLARLRCVDPSPCPLSERELDVLVLAADGRSNVEIARFLGISDQTVKNHVTHILRKLQVVDRTSAAVRALRSGWLDEERKMEGLTIGRMVHYVLPDGPARGQHRAAVVCAILDLASGVVNLQVFRNTDASGAFGDGGRPLEWRTNVANNTTGAFGTWHWIERA